MNNKPLHNETATPEWHMIDAPVNTVKARYDHANDLLHIVTIDGDAIRLDARQTIALAAILVPLFARTGNRKGDAA